MPWWILCRQSPAQPAFHQNPPYGLAVDRVVGQNSQGLAFVSTIHAHDHHVEIIITVYAEELLEIEDDFITSLD
jgi:hypothetical protein